MSAKQKKIHHVVETVILAVFFSRKDSRKAAHNFVMGGSLCDDPENIVSQAFQMVILVISV